MNIILYVLYFVFFMCFVMLFRNHLIYKIRIKAIDICYDKVKKSIDKSRELNDPSISDNWRDYYKKLDSYGEYNQMMFDFRKWTYKQFFPDFDEYEIERNEK